ncbi:glucan biosynthesis protein D, partial [Salipiger sp. HF18]
IRPVVTASRGTVSGFAAYPVVDEDYWRAIFDLDFSSIPEDDDTPIDLRMFVEVDKQERKKTWLSQLFPSQMRTLLASRP